MAHDHDGRVELASDRDGGDYPSDPADGGGDRDRGLVSFLDRARRRIDRWQRHNRPAGFAYAVQKKFSDDRGSDRCALISYYGFFSIFPLLLVAFTVLGFVLHGNPEMIDRARSSTLSKVPLLNTFDLAEIEGSGFALVIGLVAALWAGLGATQTAQDACNQVFASTADGRPNFFVKRLRGLATLGVVGVGVAAPTALAALLSAVPELGTVSVVLLAVGTFAVNTVVVAGLLRVLSAQAPGGAALWWGSAVAGVGWTILQSIGGWYVGRLVDNASRTYGVFAVVIGLLSWIFLQARIFIYAAEVASVADRGLWPRGIAEDDPTEADLRLSGSAGASAAVG